MHLAEGLLPLPVAAATTAIASGGEDGVVRLWVPSRSRTPVHQLPMSAKIEHLCWSLGEDRLLLAAAAADGTVVVLSLGP